MDITSILVHICILEYTCQYTTIYYIIHIRYTDVMHFLSHMPNVRPQALHTNHINLVQAAAAGVQTVYVYYQHNTLLPRIDILTSLPVTTVCGVVV